MNEVEARAEVDGKEKIRKRAQSLLPISPRALLVLMINFPSF